MRDIELTTRDRKDILQEEEEDEETASLLRVAAPEEEKKVHQEIDQLTTQEVIRVAAVLAPMWLLTEVGGVRRVGRREGEALEVGSGCE